LTSVPRRRPRVVYLVTSSGVGGAEQQVRSLALTFRRRGWNVGLVSMLPMEPFLAELGVDGIRTASLGMSRGVADPRGLVRLASLLRRWRPDVLHAHMVHANLMARLSRFLVRTPVVISTMHNENEGRQWRYVAYRLTDRLSDVTTSVSQGAVQEAIHRGAAAKPRIRLVPNGIRTADYKNEPEARDQTRRALGLTDQFAWLAVGRLVEAKDYPTMVSAFKRARDSHPNAKLLIAGTGPLAQSIRTSVVSAGLDPDVTLLGFRPDVAALMQAADGFVLSSAWEGLPMVLLEAAASALPIVATDVGGSRDVVIDGISGDLVAPGDDAALGRAMQKVMALSAGQRAAMGGAGRAHVSRVFNVDTIADTWEALYLAQLGRTSEGTRMLGGRRIP